jgi:hypothetical protein
MRNAKVSGLRHCRPQLFLPSPVLVAPTGTFVQITCLHEHPGASFQRFRLLDLFQRRRLIPGFSQRLFFEAFPRASLLLFASEGLHDAFPTPDHLFRHAATLMFDSAFYVANF